MYRRDTKKKRFIETLALKARCLTPLKLPESRAIRLYRWRYEDREFAACWDDAHDEAVDAVESVLYQKALSGDTIAMIFYLNPTVRSIAIN